MKKFLMFALLTCAISGMAFGQAGVADAAKVSVACPDDECHVAPYFQGSGGFVGEIADGFDEVNLVATCGNVSTSAKAEPDANGIVAMLFSMDNGLACGSNGSVEVHGLMDGGWYWITDEDNSAVAALMPKDAMGNAQSMPADPMSDDIELMMVEGGSASFVKQMSTGRVGIIPHILPEPPAPDALGCGLYVDGSDYRTRSNDCMLEVDFSIKVTHADSAGRPDAVTVGDMVYRRADATAVVLTAQVYGSGHISTGTCPAAGYDVAYGDCATRSGRSPLNAIWDVRRLDSAAGTDTLADVSIVPGAANGTEATSLTISLNQLVSCNTASTAGLTQTFRVDAITPSATSNAILPEIPGNHRNTGATTANPENGTARTNRTITVACPPASANQGQELVPDNPFPTTE